MEKANAIQTRQEWMPPRGLAGSGPRDVRLSAGGKALMALTIILAAGGIAAGVGLGWIASLQAEQSQLFHAKNVVTQGVITRLWRASGKERPPWMAYQFSDGERTIQRNAKLSLSLWRELRVGAPLPVRYVPSQPEISYPFNFSPRPLPPWLPPLVAASLFLSALLTTLPVRIQKRLLAEGRPAPAVVTRHDSAHRGKAGRKGEKKYHYEFALLSGSKVKGQAGPVKNPPAVGTTIVVIYHREDPQKNTPYPLSLVQLSA